MEGERGGNKGRREGEKCCFKKKIFFKKSVFGDGYRCGILLLCTKFMKCFIFILEKV